MLDIIKQLIKFGVVGVSNTLISYVVYIVLVYFKTHYIVASIIGFIISVLNAYYWNNKYVFKERGGEQRIWWKTLVKTFASYAGTGLILSNVLLIIWVEWTGVSEMLAPILNLLITVPLNFVMNKYWAFKDRERLK